MICWEIEHSRRARKLLLPIGELFSNRFLVEPIALPDGKVCVLKLERREFELSSGRKIFIEGREFVQEDPHRPVIRDSVVHRKQEEVLLLVENDQRGAHERAGTYVERNARLFSKYSCGGRLTLVNWQR